jgi:hypothetical protein
MGGGGVGFRSMTGRFKLCDKRIVSTALKRTPATQSVSCRNVFCTAWGRGRARGDAHGMAWGWRGGGEAYTIYSTGAHRLASQEGQLSKRPLYCVAGGGGEG